MDIATFDGTHGGGTLGCSPSQAPLIVSVAPTTVCGTVVANYEGNNPGSLTVTQTGPASSGSTIAHLGCALSSLAMSGSSASVIRIATIASTIADINNSLQFGLERTPGEYSIRPKQGSLFFQSAFANEFNL